MKKIFWLMILLFPVMVLAQVAGSPTPSPTPAVLQVVNGAVSVPAWAPPTWVIEVLTWIQSMPTVGPFVVKILAWIATIAMVATILCTAVMGILKTLSAGFGLAKLGAVAAQIDGFYEKVVPYLKFFSIYNAQFKQSQGSSSSPQSS